MNWQWISPIPVSVFLLFVGLLTPSAAQSPHNQEGLQTTRYLALNGELAPQQVANDILQFDLMKARYDQLAKSQQTNRLVLNGTLDSVELALELGAIWAAPTGLPALAMAGTAYFVSKVHDHAQEEFEKQSSEALRKRLVYDISVFEKGSKAQWQSLRQKAFEDPQEGAQKILDAFKASATGADSDLLNGLAPEHQPLVERMYLNEIVRAAEANFENLHQIAQLHGAQITRNAKDIQCLARAYRDTVMVQNQAIQDLAMHQEIIARDVQALADRQDRTEDDVAFLQEFMFGKMTAAEQRVALQRGFFAGMTEEQRKVYDRKLAMLERKEQMVTSMAKVAGGLADIANVAKNLGLSDDIVRPLTIAASAGQHVANAAAQFASGNFLGAVSAVSNLLGLGGPDPAEERHKQVMAQLNRIYGKLEGMDKKLDLLLEGQRSIIENQQKILEAVLALSEQVDLNHQETMKGLNELRGITLYGIEAIMAERNGEYESCMDVLMRRGSHGLAPEFVYMDPSRGIFPLRKDLEALHVNRKQSFVKAMNLFSTVRVTLPGGDYAYHPDFRMKTYQASEGITELISNHALLSKLLAKSSGKNWNRRTHLLLQPSPSVKALEWKMAQEAKIDVPYNEVFLRGLCNDPLMPEKLQLYASLLADFHLYYQLLDENCELLHMDQIKNPLAPRTIGRDKLREVLQMLEISQIQQSLLAGDVLLPYFYEILFLGSHSDDAEPKKWCSDALKGNKLLAANLVTYGLYREIIDRNHARAYHIALASQNKLLLEAITASPDKWNFHRRQVDGKEWWHVTVGGQDLPLPDAATLIEGKLIPTAQTPGLQRSLAEVSEEIASYSFYTQEDAGELRQFIINISQPKSN